MMKYIHYPVLAATRHHKVIFMTMLVVSLGLIAAAPPVQAESLPKVLSGSSTGSVMTGVVRQAAAGQSVIQIFLEDQQLSFTVPPQVISGRVMVPMRPIFEAMGANLEWDSSTQTATAVKDVTTVITQIGSNIATINGVAQTLDVSPTAINGSTLAPLRFVAEAFGYSASWDNNSQTAFISSAAILNSPDNSVLDNSSNLSSNAYDMGLTGNTPGNLNNEGLVCQQGNTIYFSSLKHYGALFRVQADGSGLVELTTDSAMYINVLDGWIYYSNGSDNRRIHRMRTDGSGDQKLTEDRAFFTTAAGEWVYFSNQNDGSKLYRVKTDGSQIQKLNDDYSWYINIIGDYIYYCNYYDRQYVYRIRTDGSGREKVCEVGVDDLNIAGDWMYFGNVGNLCRMHLDGSAIETLADDTVNCANVSGDWIYFVATKEEVVDGIDRIRLDGSGRQTLLEPSGATIYSVAVIGDWIYYHGWFDTERLYRMHLDGSGQEEVI